MLKDWLKRVKHVFSNSMLRTCISPAFIVWRLEVIKDVCPLNDTQIKFSLKQICLAWSLLFSHFAVSYNHVDRIGPGSRKTVSSGSCQLCLTACKYMQMKRSSHDTCTQEEWTLPFPTEDSGWWIHCLTHTFWKSGLWSEILCLFKQTPTDKTFQCLKNVKKKPPITTVVWI